MNKVDQMWYLLLICHDFATVVIPFFRAVSGGVHVRVSFLVHHSDVFPSGAWWNSL